MDKDKVTALADRYIRQFTGVISPDKLALIRRKMSGRHDSIPKNHEMLLASMTQGDESICTFPNAVSFDKERRFPTPEDRARHIGAMYSQIVQFLREGSFDKAARWAGFISGVSFVESELCATPEFYGYILSACDFVKETAKENLFQAFIYLGFAQGVLWSVGAYSINELREHILARFDQ